VVAIGYKYNKRKVLRFLATRNAGHTQQGVSYEAKWKDQFNNTCTRYVPRPDIIAKYFQHSNVVDVGNQSRQFDLKLEKMWVTECGFFRNITTIIAITITDCWKGYKHHLYSNHRHKNVTLASFGAILARHMIENDFPSTPAIAMTIAMMPSQIQTATESEGALVNQRRILDEGTYVSALTDSFSSNQQRIATVGKRHDLQLNDEWILHSNFQNNNRWKRRKRGKCMFCSCNTAYFCPDCHPKGFAKRAWIGDENRKSHCKEKHKNHIERTNDQEI